MHTILILDDEKDAIQLLEDFLSARGYKVVSAADGDEGLRLFDKEKPDLVLCDIKMPKKDGFAFLKELRASRPWVPVIMVTALTEPANILKGYDLQADYYITKPVNLEEVLKAVNLMLSLASMRKK